MICKNCQAENLDTAKFCTNCGKPIEVKIEKKVEKVKEVKEEITEKMEEKVVEATPKVDQNQSQYTGPIPEYKTTSAIIAIVFSTCCCGGWISLIFAILSLVEGSKVKNFVAQNDFKSANASLEQANKFSKIAWIIAAITAVLICLYVVFVFGMEILAAILSY